MVTGKNLKEPFDGR